MVVPIMISHINVLQRIEPSIFKNQKYLRGMFDSNTRVREGVIYTIKKWEDFIVL
jgi:hypothetical protein